MRRVLSIIKRLALPTLLTGITFSSTIVPIQPKVPVLMYHSIQLCAHDQYCLPPEQFEKQMKELVSSKYSSITATELLHFWDKKTKLPAKPIVVTFDDGYKDNYFNAYPVLKKYNIKATIFLVTGLIGRPNYLSWEQIKEMQKSGLVDFESHTVHHPDLSKLPPEQVYQELVQSKQTIEKELRKPVKIFAYPYGMYKRTTLPLLKKAGYEMAFNSNPGLASPVQGQYLLKRIAIHGNNSVDRFIQLAKSPVSKPAQRIAPLLTNLAPSEK